MEKSLRDAALGTASPTQTGETKKRRARNGHTKERLKRGLDRLEHFTWANYTLPMSTGGLALLLSDHTQVYSFAGLHTIGKVVYVFDVVLFILVTAAIVYRFVSFPGTLKASVTHPTEGLFLATSVLSVASLVTGLAHYGIPATGRWLRVVYQVLFWMYFAISYVLAVVQYVLLFTSPHLKIQDMTPAWDLPIFPFMLCGTVASAGAGAGLVDDGDRIPMMVAGLVAQGLGMMVSLAMYASYIRRMIQYGFPSPNSRPGMFIAVGPPSFTSLAIIGLANDYVTLHLHPSSDSHSYFENAADTETVGLILRVMAVTTSLFIWSLSLWFFCIAVVACFAVRKKIGFHLNWWSVVFPNVGFTVAVLTIGKALDSPGVLWTGTVMTCCIVCTWIFVFVCQVRAVIRKDIWWDGKDEDFYVDERKHDHGKVV